MNTMTTDDRQLWSFICILFLLIIFLLYCGNWNIFIQTFFKKFIIIMTLKLQETNFGQNLKNLIVLFLLRFMKSFDFINGNPKFNEVTEKTIPILKKSNSFRADLHIPLNSKIPISNQNSLENRFLFFLLLYLYTATSCSRNSNHSRFFILLIKNSPHILRALFEETSKIRWVYFLKCILT